MFGQTEAYSPFNLTQLSRPGWVSGKMASAGHSGSQTPQSMHSSGWMTSMLSPSYTQSPDQTSTVYVFAFDAIVGADKGHRFDSAGHERSRRKNKASFRPSAMR